MRNLNEIMRELALTQEAMIGETDVQLVMMLMAHVEMLENEIAASLEEAA